MPPSGVEPAVQLAASKDGKWIVHLAAALLEQCGAKAMGLLLLPPAWTSPWVVVSRDASAQAATDSSWTALADCLLQHLWGKEEPEGRLIVRSSAPDENMDLRGHYESSVCAAHSATLATALEQVAFQQIHEGANDDGRPACALVVQRYLEPDFLGHLSNEYRHAQRNVDFLHDHFAPTGATSTRPASFRPASFRLPRPVLPPGDDVVGRELKVPSRGGGLDDCLRVVGSWLAAKNLRGHLEWVQTGGRLFLVQLDVDPLPEHRQPMAEVPSPNPTAIPADALAPFGKVDQGDYKDLRKTRSHALLHAAGAFVPPIFVARNVGEEIRDISSPLWLGLAKLLFSPAVIRFDVPLDREEWTNLPTIVTTAESASEVFGRVQAAVEEVLARGVLLANLTVVVHHFIAAKASAWSEARPRGEEVRIDATWGMPDGLQSFAHDSIIYSCASGSVKPEVRYKDRFVDVASDGKWVVRRAAPSLARAEVCDVSQVREMARITLAVAEATGQTVRIMWFIDVLTGAITKTDSLLPWIVEELQGSGASAPKRECVGSDGALDLRRRADVSGGRALRTPVDLLAFRKRPQAYDLGDRFVLFQPDAAVVRDRAFLQEFAKTICDLSPPWKVLYAGSMLSHAPYQLQQYGLAVIPLHDRVRPPRRTVLRKLVRDGIPERVNAGGEVADVVVLNDDEYEAALRQKLVEEALEVAYSGDQDELREELADLLTVAQALSKAGGAGEWASVETAAVEKASKVGGFDSRVYLRATGYYRRTEDDTPGGSDVQRLRNGDGVRIPLIPPLVPKDRRQVVAIPSLGLELILVYGEQHIEVRLQKERVNRTSPQLSLFGDSEDADDDGSR